MSLSVLIGLLWKSGSLVFDGWALSGLVAWKYAFAWALVFLLVGIFEESLLRGYLQYTLSRGIGFWWTALLLSVVFALLHTRNVGESLLGFALCRCGWFRFLPQPPVHPVACGGRWASMPGGTGANPICWHTKQRPDDEGTPIGGASTG